jgi:plastin-1
LKLPPEEILKRWLNYHLNKAGQEPVNNLGKDLADSQKLMYVLNQLDPQNCSLDGKDEADLVVRAQKMIDNSRAMGCGDVVGAKAITKGNPKVNIILVAEMFNTKHGLDDLEEPLDLAGIIDDDIEGSKEERAFRMWINSLGIEGVFIDNLYEDLKDGLVLCKVIHRINDTVVEWDRVVNEPNNIFKKGINC